jgi:hypothetical protein
MFENLWNSILEWFNDRSERAKLIRGFNEAAKLSFVTGQAPTLLKASISRGENAYKHQFSNWLNSGFRIQAFTGRVLKKEELVKIGNVILDDNALVRRLVVLGWDTLEIHGDSGQYGCRWQLKDYLLLENSIEND